MSAGEWQVVEAAFTKLGWNMTPIHSLREHSEQLEREARRAKALTFAVNAGAADVSMARVEQLEEALRETALRVHLILSDHYSGCREEREAAMPAYSWLTVVYEREDEEGNAQIRDIDAIIRTAHDPVAAGLHPHALTHSEGEA